MLQFLADNIFILLDGRLFQRTIGIPKGRNRPPILTDLFLHVYEAFCLEELLKNKNSVWSLRSTAHTLFYSLCPEQ